MNFFKRRDDLTLDNEAAEWLVRLEDHEPEIQAKFFAWLQKSPHHVHAYLGIAGAFQMLDNLDPQRRIDVQDLIAEGGSNVVPIRGTTNSNALASGVEPNPPRTGRRLWLIASSVVVFLAVGWLAAVNVPWGVTTYETAVGERREIKLDDGSIIGLNTRSRLQVSYSKQARDVRLLEGEALFSVAHDKLRPFRVAAGESTIQAVGTQFNVYRHREGTTVAVVEGVVQISRTVAPSATLPAASEPAASALPESPSAPAESASAPMRLAAGEVANVVTGGRVLKSKSPDVSREIAWQKRELIFTDAPLEFVAEQFNRYNKQQIQLQGEAVRRKQISGIFDADYPQSLILFLASDPSLQTEHSGDNLVIRTN